MDNFGSYVVLAFFGLVGLSIYRSRTSQSRIVISVNDSKIIKHHGISLKARNQLESFFRQDVQLDSKVVIRGHQDGQGRIRYQFKGPIPPGTQQQIRNFLHSIIPPNKPKSRGNSCA